MRSLARLTTALLLIVLLVATGGPHSTASAAPLLEQPSVTSSSAAADVSVRTIRQSYDLLLDRFFQTLAPEDLLSAGWFGVTEELKRLGAADLDRPVPAFGGDRTADWQLFEARYIELATAAATTIAPAKLSQVVIRAMVAAVDEGHTNYLDPDQYKDYLAWTRGEVKYSGIGARLHGSEPTIVEVFDGSPAQRAGLRAGDVLVEVNGKQLTTRRSDEAVQEIRGPEGTTVRVTVRRQGNSEPLTFEIVRATIQLPLVTSKLVDDAVGYIALRSFPEPSVLDQVDRAYAELRDQGAHALVFDLRGNSGGRLDVGVQMLSRFVADGTLYEEYDRSGQRRTSAPDGQLWNPLLPVAVLVDGGTASMGEIFAAAIQERHVGLLFGTRTAGNVAAAQVFPLDDGSALQVTVLEIRSGEGKTLNRVGVEPDLAIETSPADAAGGTDPPLAAAIEHLREKLAEPPELQEGSAYPLAA